MKLPDEFKGPLLKGGGLTKYQPRKWTEKEIEWALDLKAKNYTMKEIAEALDRDVVQVQIKMKRISKALDQYNFKHRDDKYTHNQLFLEAIRPDSVLDLFSGENSFYSNRVKVLHTNDCNKNFKATYNEKADKLLCKLYYQNKKYDLVDLDPFGSAYDCFDLALRIAKKGIVITFGELGHLRFKRIDYVNRMYGIESIECFTLENLIAEVQKIGLRHRKKLVPIYTRNWKNIGRVYFQIQTK